MWFKKIKSSFYINTVFDVSPVRTVKLFIIACCAKIHLMYTRNNVIIFQTENLGGGFEVIRIYITYI